MDENVVDRAFTVDFRFFLGPFSVVAYCIVLEFVDRSSDTCSSPSLSVTSATGRILRGVVSRRHLCMFGLKLTFQFVGNSPSSDCGTSHSRSDDIVLGMASSSIDTVSVEDERKRYEPSL